MGHGEVYSTEFSFSEENVSKPGNPNPAGSWRVLQFGVRASLHFDLVLSRRRSRRVEGRSRTRQGRRLLERP